MLEFSLVKERVVSLCLQAGDRSLTVVSAYGSGCPCSSSCPRDPATDKPKKMDEWMDDICQTACLPSDIYPRTSSELGVSGANKNVSFRAHCRLNIVYISFLEEH